MVSKSDSFLLRKINVGDEKILLNWMNDPEVRKHSFSSNTITQAEHKNWFKSKLCSPNVFFFILENNNRPAGLVRLEREDNKVLLGYLIASQFRGSGLASKMLKMAMNEVRRHWQNINIFAYTLPGNTASIRSLLKAGFSLKSTGHEKNCYVFHITKGMNKTSELCK